MLGVSKILTLVIIFQWTVLGLTYLHIWISHEFDPFIVKSINMLALSYFMWNLNPCGSGLEYILFIHLRIVRGNWRKKKRGPVLQQVWHDKRPSLLKVPEYRSKFCSPSPVIVTFPYSENSWAWRKTIKNQSINYVKFPIILNCWFFCLYM
jgi:hypothetical protein